jgi:RNA polymerase sigma-70 factor (ECF subfamily)
MLSQASPLLSPSEIAAEERRWVVRVRTGDEAAMTLLVGRHRRRLLRAASNILRDTHEAEDAAQEAFLKAFREIHKLRDDKAFSGFLYRICIRLCMDRLRSRKSQPGIVEGTSPSRGTEVETKVVVEKLLEKLSPELRLTLVLREMEQFSYDEIAETMEVPVGTVRSRLHAAREKFREYWIEANPEAV